MRKRTPGQAVTTPNEAVKQNESGKDTTVRCLDESKMTDAYPRR